MSQPQLLCFHPGGFARGDPTFEDDAVAYADEWGFAAVACPYPEISLADQRTWAITCAAGYSTYGPVYAYGDSAGGSLAAFLATRGRVQAAACYGAVPNLWNYFQRPYGFADWTALGQPTQADCDLTSPALHSVTAACKVHAYRGVGDAINTEADYAAWTDPNVVKIDVPGDHLGGGPPGATYENNMHQAINWLAWCAGLL